MTTRVTATDLDTGETITRTIEDDYALISCRSGSRSCEVLDLMRENERLREVKRCAAGVVRTADRIPGPKEWWEALRAALVDPRS
jgi:hypothetical protein